MNQWSRTRKRIVMLIVLFVVVVMIGVPMFFLFYRAPSCFDGVMNGDETGVDCGGSCQKLCTAESLPILSRGDSRVILVVPGAYEVVAIFENPNVSAEVSGARYTVKLFDASSTIPIKTIEGETFVPKGKSFAIFEGPFSFEAGITPSRAVFEWDKQTLDWKKNNSPLPAISISSRTLSRESSSPRLEAVVENASLDVVSNIELIALLSDAEGNIFAASKTFIDALPAGEESLVIFSWPLPFSKQAVEIEIVSTAYPDRSFLR
jgi:hypothetical protein